MHSSMHGVELDDWLSCVSSLIAPLSMSSQRNSENHDDEDERQLVKFLVIFSHLDPRHHQAFVMKGLVCSEPRGI